MARRSRVIFVCKDQIKHYCCDVNGLFTELKNCERLEEYEDLIMYAFILLHSKILLKIDPKINSLRVTKGMCKNAFKAGEQFDL